MPPPALTVALYCVLTLPSGTDAVVIVSVPLTVMLKLAVAVSIGLLESVTLAVKLNVPVDVGVPEIWPVLAFSVTFEGRLPELMLQV